MAQKDTDARWTLKFAKARGLPDGRPGIDIAIPSFGCRRSIAVCWRYGFIHRGKVTDGAHFDGRVLRDVVTRDNTASDVGIRHQASQATCPKRRRTASIH